MQAGGFDQPALALVRRRDVPARRSERLARHRRELALGERVQDERLQQVTRDESGRRLHGLVDCGDWVADIALELPERTLVARDRKGIGPGHRDAP